MKIFLSDTSSYLGKALKAHLVANHEVLDPIVEVQAQKDDEQAGVEAEGEAQGEAEAEEADAKAADSSPKQTISLWEDPEGLKEMLLSAELIVLDLVRNAENSTTVLNILKEVEHFDSEINVIGVSSVMTWSRTYTKDKDKLKPLRESDYKTRKTSAKFKGLKMMETLVLNAQKEDLNTFVVASGILYGEGEEQLHGLFREAWMCETPGLPCIGEGSNVVPTMHVADFAAAVERVGVSPPSDQQYVVFTDNGNTTQRQLVEAISGGLGNGETLTLPADHEKVLMGDSDQSVLLINLHFDQENSYQSSSDLALSCENGLQENVDRVRTEFVKSRGLRPSRIMMHGPPGSGKSHHAAILAKQYYLPHIVLEDLLKETLGKGDELAEQIQKSLDDAEAATKPVGKGKKKPAPAPKKAKGKGAKAAVIDSHPRIPLDLLTQMYKKKLRSAACRNKGFILDGYPRTLEESVALFKKQLAEGEEEELPDPDDEGEGDEAAAAPTPRFDPSTMVDYVITLDCSQQQGMERLQALDESQVIAGHNDEEGFLRRWANFEAANDPQADVLQSPLQYLKTVEILDVPVDVAADTAAATNSMKMYVEKNGKAYNYHPTPAEEAVAKAEAEAEAREAQVKADSEKAQKEQEEREEWRERQQRDTIRKAQVLLDDQELVEACSLPLRKYLMANVIPHLVDGLLGVCKVQPEDPIDYLAEFLYKRSVSS